LTDFQKADFDHGGCIDTESTVAGSETYHKVLSWGYNRGNSEAISVNPLAKELLLQLFVLRKRF
jgi:hypothetical protein